MNAARSQVEGAAVGHGGEIIASFSSLSEARQAFHCLTEAGIPTHRLHVVRHDVTAAGRRGLTARRLAEAGLVGGALGAMILVLSAVVGVAGTAASDLTLATVFLGAASGAAAAVVAVLVTGATSLERDPRLAGGPYDLEVDPLVSERAIVALQMAQRRG